MGDESIKYIKFLEETNNYLEGRIAFLEAIIDINSETLTKSINTNSMLLEYLKENVSFQ